MNVEGSGHVDYAKGAAALRSSDASQVAEHNQRVEAETEANAEAVAAQKKEEDRQALKRTQESQIRADKASIDANRAIVEDIRRNQSRRP